MLRSATAAALLVGASVAPSQAQDGNSGGTASYTLGELSVTAPTTAGQTTTVVTSEQVRELGARTLDEALRNTPGVTIDTRAQGVPRITLRGLPPRETQIFLNGVPLNSAADGQPDPSLIPTENIAEIKVIQGTSSVLYGPGTVAGLVDVITKRGTTGVHSDAGVEIGSGGARRLFATVSGGIENFDYFVSGSHTARNEFVLPGGLGRENSDFVRSNIFGNFGVQLGDWRFGLTVSAVDGNQGLPPNTFSAAANNPFTGGQFFERLDRVSGRTAQFDATYQAGGPFTLRMSAYVNASSVADNRYDNAAYTTMIDPTVKTFREIIDTTVSGGQTQAIYDFGAFGSLTGSFLVRREEEVLTGQIRDVPLAGTGSGTGGGNGTGSGRGTGQGGSTPQVGRFGWRLLDQDDAVTTYSAAAEYRVDPLPRTHLTLGYSHHWFEQPGAQHQGNQLMVGVAYDLTSTLQAFGSYAQKVRFATIDQLFNPQQGNSLLRPEQSENYEGGIIWVFSPSGSATVSGFHNNVKNFILNNPITQSFFNEDIVVAGAQVIASYSPFPGLTFRPGYTYLDVRDPVTGLPTDYRPRHVVNFQVAYVPAATWLVSADLQYVADQSVGSKSNAATRFEVGDYTIVNARIQKSFPELALDCYVRGTNLLDERYIYSVGFPAAGRTIYAGLEYHF